MHIGSSDITTIIFADGTAYVANSNENYKKHAVTHSRSLELGIKIDTRNTNTIVV